jgi:hypothetical protein
MAQVQRKAVRMASKKAISPKVTVPAVAQAVAGIVLVILGAIPSIVDDGGTRTTLLTLGLGLLGASGLTGVLGFQANPGQVIVNE